MKKVKDMTRKEINAYLDKQLKEYYATHLKAAKKLTARRERTKIAKVIIKKLEKSS